MYQEITIITKCPCCGHSTERIFHDKEEAKRFIENNEFEVATGTTADIRDITTTTRGYNNRRGTTTD